METTLKKEYKNTLFDIMNKSGFKPEEFRIDNPEGGDHIYFDYYTENNRFVFKLDGRSQKEYLLTFISPLNPEFKERTIKVPANTADNWGRIKYKIANFFSKWLKEINEEIRIPDKFTQYFNNLNKIKFIDIPESKGKQPPNNTDSKILIQQLDDIKETISNTKDILLDGQEILFDDLEEIREDIKKKQSSIRGVINKIIGAIFSWGLYFAIPSEVVKNLFEQIKDGIRKMLGE